MVWQPDVWDKALRSTQLTSFRMCRTKKECERVCAQQPGWRPWAYDLGKRDPNDSNHPNDALGDGRHEDAALLARYCHAPKGPVPVVVGVQAREQQVELELGRHSDAMRTQLHQHLVAAFGCAGRVQ